MQTNHYPSNKVHQTPVTKHRSPNITQRILALFLTFTIFLPTVTPYNNLWANNNGPNAPEASGFEPVDATDMVNLATGDVTYVLPLLDMDGFPVSLSYHAGIPMDLESSWVGLGWNINTGAINRDQTGVPDDWKDGKSLDFINYSGSETKYTINVGIGISQVADVGVGISWGSNKGLVGSVYASAGINLGDSIASAGASASLSTDGGYSVGIGISVLGDTGFGGGIGASVSGNLNTGDVSFGIGLNAGTRNAQASLGFSFSDSGTSTSIGASGGNLSGSGSQRKGIGGGGSFNSGSFTEDDVEINTSGFYIPVQIKIFTFGFGKQKVVFSLRKGFKKSGYGILYKNSANAALQDNIDLSGSNHSKDYTDYQNRYIYGDMYEQTLSQSEEEFVGDHRQSLERINFAHASYDNYEVNASGISGRMHPYAMQSATALMGIGYSGSNPYSTSNSNKKMRMYYHNSNPNLDIYRKTFGTGNETDFQFYFSGQFTQHNLYGENDLLYTGDVNQIASTKNLSFLVRGGNDGIQERRKSANFIEVYTNEQIKNGTAVGLMQPESLPTRNTLDYKDSGIGAYKITAPDGKTYHFSLPVNHYEMVQTTLIKDGSGDHVNEQRQFTPYATHWLLTAITGPDFMDVNGNNMPDNDDYGSWVRLDHGKWSDAYVWRNPSKPGARNYNTNLINEIDTEDFGHYQFGRKQLYFLDKIVTRNSTAYFVKDLRYDAVGRGFNFKFTGGGSLRDAFGSNVLSENGVYVNAASGQANQNNIYVREDGIDYKTEYQLLLDKIVVVDNDIQVSKQSPANKNLNYFGISSYSKNDFYKPDYNEGGGFYQEYASYPNYKIHNENGIYDRVDFENFDYMNASKVIDFDYDYGLAEGTPSSINTPYGDHNKNLGKLCLRSVQNLGRNLVEYMPAYEYGYIGHPDFGSTRTYPANAHANKSPLNEKILTTYKDNWGFLKSDPSAWSMNSIKTPTGGLISIEYEEDDYYTEAFSRRYWDKDLGFNFERDFNTEKLLITITKEPGYIYNINFEDYFGVGDELYFDMFLWLARREIGKWPACRNNYVDIYVDVKSTDLTTINSVSRDELVVEVDLNSAVLARDDLENVEMHRLSILDFNNIYSHSSGISSNNGVASSRSDRPGAPYPGCGNGRALSRILYKLLATKVPPDETGGGLRAKAITTVGQDGERYKSSYDYNVPGTDRSSGITSFAPVNGIKYVPMQSELPGAGVMYEYVTMTNESDSGIYNKLGSTQYHFYTLSPVRDIFTENLDMRLDDGTQIFKSTVTDHGATSAHAPYYLNDTGDVLHRLEAKTVNVEVNTSMIGMMRSVSQFNNQNQLLSVKENRYTNGEELHNNIGEYKRGSVKESFVSLKTLAISNKDDVSPYLFKRLFSHSTRKEYNSVLTQKKTTTQFGINTQTYSNADEESGVFKTIETELPNGVTLVTEKTPAYSKYSEMGPKTDNVNNKHMITQEAMEIVSKKTGSNENVISANVTTWNNTWNYRYGEGNEITETDIWRKHKNYIWKEAVNENGGFETDVTEGNFNWEIGGNQVKQWQKVSEVTRYTHNSSPIETKDINGKYASVKMSNDNNKILATSNARYSDFFVSGAENVFEGNVFEGEVEGADFRTNEDAHTGTWSVKNNNVNDKVFEINKPLPYGKYIVSFWSKVSGSVDIDATEDDGVSLYINNIKLEPTERVASGCWMLNNYLVNVNTTTLTDLNLYITNIQSANVFFDDFRFYPITSSVSSYVYDGITNQLTDVLGPNNLANKYCYDLAGRLCTTYLEVPTQGNNVGGFKVVSRNNYKYANVDTDTEDYGCNCSLTTCVTNDSDFDGISDQLDNCPNIYNLDQLDTDNDGIGNDCDEDDDGDGFLDSEDYCPLIATNFNIDSDFDGIGDECDDDDNTTVNCNVDTLYPTKTYLGEQYNDGHTFNYAATRIYPPKNSTDIGFYSFSPKLSFHEGFLEVYRFLDDLDGEHPLTLRIYKSNSNELVSVLTPKFKSLNSDEIFGGDLNAVRCYYTYGSANLEPDTDYKIIISNPGRLYDFGYFDFFPSKYEDWTFKTGSVLSFTNEGETYVTDISYLNYELNIKQSNNSKFERSFLYFNTSAIPDDATISSAKLRLTRKDNNNNESLKVFKGYQPCIPNVIDYLDFKKFQLTNVHSYDSSQVLGELNSWTYKVGSVSDPTNYYTEIDLLAGTNYGYIDKSGLTRLALISSQEIENEENGITFSSAFIESDDDTYLWLNESMPLLCNSCNEETYDHEEFMPRLTIEYDSTSIILTPGQ